MSFKHIIKDLFSFKASSPYPNDDEEDYGFGTTPQFAESDTKEEKDSKYPKILLMGLRRQD
jgi:hypothetical protein